MYGNFQSGWSWGWWTKSCSILTYKFGPENRSLGFIWSTPSTPCPPKNRPFCQGLSSSLANKKRGMDEEDQEFWAKFWAIEETGPLRMFRLFLGDEVSYPVVLGLFDKPWNKDPYSPSRIQMDVVSEGLVPSRFAHFRGQTHTQAPHPRKLTAKTTPKTWWLLVGRQTLPFESCFFFGGDLSLNFLGWHLGHCVFFFFFFHFSIFVPFLLSCFFPRKLELWDFGTPTLTIHFFSKKKAIQTSQAATVSLFRGTWVFFRTKKYPKNVFTAFFFCW